MNKSNDTLIWVDYIRVFATCSVILLHIAAAVAMSYGKIPMSTWWVGNLYDGSVRACVPLFLMLTGALIIPHEMALPMFLKKRLSRVLYPFLFWSFIYIIYQFTEPSARAPTDVLLMPRWAYGQLQNGAMYHLWYVYVLIGIYLFLPIIGRWLRTATELETLYYLGLWFITLCCTYAVINDYVIHVNMVYLSGYLGYIVLGYYLSRKSFNQKWLTPLAVAVVIFGFALTVVGMFVYSRHHNQANETAYGNLTPNVMLMAAGIFCLFRHATLPPLTGVFKVICRNSYTIYLAHPLILVLFYKCGINAYTLNPIAGIPLLAVAVLAVSTAFAWAINKSPAGRYIGG